MLNPIRDAELLQLGRETGGAADISECLTAGLTHRRLHQLVQSGRWQHPFPRVFVTFSGPIPPLTMHHAALLYAGPHAALSHDSAGWLWRLCKAPEVIHLSIPYARRVRPQVGIVIHRSRTLSGDEIHPALSPQRTRIERTVIDLLGGARDADGALALVADAMRQRRTTPERLRQVLIRHQQIACRHAVLMALPDVAAGAHSLLEIKDAAMRRTHGLPMGTRQFRRDTSGVEHLDVLIEEFSLHVELDGRLGHSRATEVWRDYRRDNHSEVLRLRHLRYGWADMIGRPCEVAAQQADILLQQGWQGPMRTCRHCRRPA